MSPDAAFALINVVAFAGWLALLATPLSPVWTQRIAAVAAPLALAAFYVWLVARGLRGSSGEGSLPDFTTLDGVAAIFATREAVLAAWTHFLAFDLFVGAWEARDARRRGIPHGFVIPSLVLTFLSGPLGFLLYRLTTLFFRRRRPTGHALGNRVDSG